MQMNTAEADTLEKTEIDTDLDAAFRDIVGHDEETVFDNTDGDHERFSHYVTKEDIILSATSSPPTAVFALCGKKWVPSKNPEGFPVCPECKSAYELKTPAE